MRKRFLLLAVAALALSAAAIAQQKIMPNPYYNVIVKPVGTNQGLPIQSFVAGRKGDTLLVIGGRTKGLHNFSGTSFPYSTNNTRLYVFIPAKDASSKSQIFSTGIPGTLSAQQQLQLSSSNMEYCQTGDVLYALGGYGYNGGTGKDSSYGTFNGFYAVAVPDLIRAIVKGDTASGNVSKYFTFSTQPSSTDSTMAVTGGELVKMGDSYCLVVGQNAQGEYSSKHGFYQVYTNKITRLQFAYTPGKSLTYNVVETVYNSDEQLHRRDLNVVPVITAEGGEGIDIYGGVFTPTQAGGPYLNPVLISTNKRNELAAVVDYNMVQYLNQYSAAHALLYSNLFNIMQTSLLGGISLYDSVVSVNNNEPIGKRDTSMPWSNLISTISRNSSGTYVEYASDANDLPGYVGAEAKFVPAANYLYGSSDEILNLDNIGLAAIVSTNHTVTIGYMVGGIVSIDSNGTSTSTNPTLYTVALQIKAPVLKQLQLKKK